MQAGQGGEARASLRRTLPLLTLAEYQPNTPFVIFVIYWNTFEISAIFALSHHTEPNYTFDILTVNLRQITPALFDRRTIRRVENFLHRLAVTRMRAVDQRHNTLSRISFGGYDGSRAHQIQLVLDDLATVHGLPRSETCIHCLVPYRPDVVVLFPAPCTHKTDYMHRHCLQRFLESELVCPIPNCRAPVTVAVVVT